jgi:protein TilB
MPKITADLLRRRAEHNEGCLSDLKEIALHQQDIEKIEVVGDMCRQLEILYLCNNYIGKIEGLHHLKNLQYLNLAVNNISYIEGLEGCEMLQRLDLTLNFITDMTCIGNLRANSFLETLHLIGNACTKTPGYRAFVIHTLPHLVDLDGEVVLRSEKIAARQDEDEVTEVVNDEAVKVREEERIKQELVAKRRVSVFMVTLLRNEFRSFVRIRKWREKKRTDPRRLGVYQPFTKSSISNL